MTFAELGIPFPLFEAPIDLALGYQGAGRCVACGENRPHCFRVDGYLMLPCPHCGVENGLPVFESTSTICYACRALMHFPDLPQGEVLVCYDCLRQGKAAITKDTVLGVISWEQTVEGVTHGIPGLKEPGFELIEREPGWYGARIPPEDMWELLRTPTYLTYQGEQWQFCHGKPMVYLGEWSQSDFHRHAPDGNGRELFSRLLPDTTEAIWNDIGYGSLTVYAFRCQTCGGFKAHWDMD